MTHTPIRVLLVDDDEDDMILTRQVLRDADPDGYEVEWASDVDQGLDRLSGGGYDVCLVDYRIGPQDGVEFIRRAVERGAGAPMILLTGQGDRTVDVAAMNAGAADFLNKGQLNAAVLERAIRYSIQQRRSEQQRIRLLMEQAARAEAEAANRAKDEFLAVLSHELRTPLTAVLMNVADLEQAAAGALSPDAREAVGVIKRNVELEARLIDDLLDLTRITRGKLEIRREVVDVHEQIDYAINCSCAADITAKGLSVTAGKAARRYHVWGDPARLQQVLWNLIKNAVKFTPQGGRIEVTTANAGDAAGRLRVEVRDSGIGIRADALPKIFNAFEQADRSITRRFGGLGLGLAICRALVELHGGTVHANSAGIGRGATFSFELPVSSTVPRGDVPPPAQAPGAAAAMRGGPAVHVPAPSGKEAIGLLLVEDHADTARAMRRLLARRGYVVHVATGLADALRLADHATFDVLISDIGLPDGSGLDLVRRLRQRRPQLRAIALSGYGMEQDVERSRAAGFAEHLTKPIDLAQLEAAIDRAASSLIDAAAAPAPPEPAPAPPR